MPGETRRPRSWLLWAGIAFAFSPTLFDLFTHLVETPWTRYVLVFPLLFLRCAVREGHRAPAARSLPWIAFGLALALQVLAAFLGAIRWARPGALVAVLALCARDGIASWRTRALLVFAVPVPAFLLKHSARGLTVEIGQFAADFWSALGHDVTLTGNVFYAGAERLFALNLYWLALAPLLAGLAWYDGALGRRSLRSTALAAAGCAALSLPIEALALVAAIGAAAFWQAGEAAQGLIDHGAWIATMLVGIALAELHSGHPHGEAPPPTAGGGRP